MRSKKKPGIQLKIFLPVFMILIIFPIAVFLLFGVVANGYFKQMAERNTDRLVIQTRRVIREAHGDADRNEAKNDTETGKSNNKEQEQEKEEFLIRIEELMLSGNNKTSVLVLGNDLRLSWPKEGELTEATS